MPLDELRFREGLRLRQQELELKERELDHRLESEARSSTFKVSPLTTAVIAGVLTIVTSVVTAALNAKWNRESEERTAAKELHLKEIEQRFQIILRATADRTPEEAARNLLFFVEIGYLLDPENKIRDKAKSGDVPVITSKGLVNPIEERARVLAPSTLDEAAPEHGGELLVSDHILCTSDGSPVSVVAASSLGTLEEPRLVVMHFTAGGTLESAVRTFSGNRISASAHVLIGRDGKIVQMVPFDYASFHAGTGTWKELKQLNRYSIGIDLVNWGQLQRKDDKWITMLGRELDTGEVFEQKDPATGDVSGWQRYTEPQIASALAVTKALMEAYPTLTDIVNHSDVSPGRKTDPGPAFPIQRFRDVFDNGAP